jgi:hypothetical protein
MFMIGKFNGFSRITYAITKTLLTNHHFLMAQFNRSRNTEIRYERILRGGRIDRRYFI